MPKRRNLVNNILTSGTLDTLAPELRRRIIILNLMIFAGSIVLFIFAAVAFLESNILRAGLDAGLALFLIFVLVYMRIVRRFTLASYLSVLLTSGLFVFLGLTPGRDGSGGLWLLSLPLVTIFLVGLRPGIIIAVSSLAILLSFYAMGTLSSAVPAFAAVKKIFDLSFYTPDFIIRMAGTYFITGLFSGFYEFVRISTQARLEESNLDLERTSQDLMARKQQTDSIFTNVNEGIFLLNKSLRFDSEYSKALEQMLGRNALAGISFLSIIQDKVPDKAAGATKDYLEMFFSPQANLELLAGINPLEQAELNFVKSDGGFDTKHLDFTFARIGDTEATFKILGAVRDVTEQVELTRKLQAQQDNNKKQMASLFQIIQVESRLMHEFIEDAEEELENVNAILKSDEQDFKFILDNMFQSVHAIKGNAVLLGLDTIGERLHKLEDEIRVLQDRETKWDDLFKLTVHLTEIQSEIDTVRQLIDKIVSFQASVTAGAVTQKNLMVSYIERIIKRLQADLKKEVRLTAKEFAGTLISPRYRKTVKDVIIQLTRNALAHGIETPAERTHKQKDPIGTISLTTQKLEGKLTIVFRDDGRGFDPGKIRNRAKQLAAFREMDIDKMTDAQAIGIVFKPGFSSSDTPDMHSGRGVGLRLVKNKIEEVGGTFKIRSAKDKYSEFIISFPS